MTHLYVCVYSIILVVSCYPDPVLLRNDCSEQKKIPLNKLSVVRHLFLSLEGEDMSTEMIGVPVRAHLSTHFPMALTFS